MSKTNRVFIVSSLNLVLFVSCLSALADEGHCSIDWNKLNLSSPQQQQLQVLEAEWNKQYAEIKPAIAEEQRKLAKLLADHTSDPVEIMSLQQTIARKKESLNQLATANYLRKRQLLNESQQYNLEIMVKNAVAMRQRAMSPGGQTEVMPDRVQSLIERVRNIHPTSGQ